MRARAVPLIGLLGILTGSASAANFEMVLNKDNKLCPHMLSLVNQDLHRLGDVHYESHGEFSALEWKSMAAMGEKFKDDFCSVHRMARTDLTNDGKDDIVVKLSGCFKSVLRDSLYILAGDDQKFSTYTEPGDIIANALGRFGANSYNYSVKELPPIREAFGITVYPGVGGWMIIHPFIFQGVTYIAVSDRTSQGFVIGKYKDFEQLDNLCYFEMEKLQGVKKAGPKQGKR